MISRYAKVKTKKGSEEKKCLKRQAFSNANTSSLHLPCRSTWLAQHSFFFQTGHIQEDNKEGIGIRNPQVRLLHGPGRPKPSDEGFQLPGQAE